MSEAVETDGANGGSVTGRSRRQKRENVGRQAALDKLRRGERNKCEVVEDDAGALYDLVDEREYSRRVQQRLDDNWIVDDGSGEYVEDGREIFDDDIVGDGGGASSSGRRHRARQPGTTSGKRVCDPSQPKRANIRDMLLTMPSKKAKRDVKLEEDEDLQSIIQGIKSSPALPVPSHRSAPTSRRSVPSAAGGSHVVQSRAQCVQQTSSTTHAKLPLRNLTSSSVCNSSLQTTTTTTTGDADTMNARETHLTSVNKQLEHCAKIPPADDKMKQDNAAQSFADELDDDFLSPMLDECDAQPTESDAANLIHTDASSVESSVTTGGTAVTDVSIGDDWLRTTQLLQPCVKPDRVEEQNSSSTLSSSSSLSSPLLDSSALSLFAEEEGCDDKVFRFFWLDAYSDHVANAGVVYLFGRVSLSPSSSSSSTITDQTYTTCCVRLDHVPRRVFLLPRVKRMNVRTGEEGDDITIKDVYDEFSQHIATRFKIPEFRSKVTSKKYAFELADVPDQADYLEVVYSSEYRELPCDLQGETFSRVFGANTSTLERLILEARLRGPGWLRVRRPQLSPHKLSFCAIEVCASWNEQAGSLWSTNQACPPPPLTVLTLGCRTVVERRHHQNQMVLVSVLVHNQFRLDRPPPTPVFQQHFCAVTRPDDCVWPFDIDKQLAGFGATSVRKCVNEKALLAFLLAKINKIDPDIVVGHNLYGFDLDIILSRCRQLKLNTWCHLGRLRRSADILFKSRMSDEWLKRSVMCGRLLCDSFLSAKELTRQKSYDLPELCRTVLRQPEVSVTSIHADAVASMYDTSRSLLQLVTATMQDAHNTMRVVAELNALPLALQITCLAGNLLSRTLLGGRAERNEFLLLHAFTERGFLPPDKRKPGKKGATGALPSGEGDVGDEDGDKRPKRKAKYGGGLVLEPKKGFYDHYILLMDFNSLYPSIIQEYNICFTTLPRLAPSQQQDERQDGEEASAMLDLPSANLETGILPAEIRKLVERRREVKKLMKNSTVSSEELVQLDVRQKALKLTANSMYGCLGFEASRFYAKHLAALVTAKGRDILMQTKSLVEKMDLEVVYGDTDSIMINSRLLNFDRVMELGKEIKREVNKLYRLLELDVDGLYRYMLLLKKKKYAAVAATRQSSSSSTTSGSTGAADSVIVFSRELKGLDIVRRDWCKLAADTGLYVIDQIFSGLEHDEKLDNIHSHLEAMRQHLHEGQFKLTDLVITKELKKNPEEYADKKGQAHVNVALRVNSKSARRLRRGDTVHYIVCQDGSAAEAMQRAYSIDEVRASQTSTNGSSNGGGEDADKSSGVLSVDVTYYLAHQVHPVVSRLLEPVECTDAARVALCLGLDASKYRNQGGGGSHGNQHAPDESADGSLRSSLANKFASCRPLSVRCVECKHEQKFSAPLTDGTTMSLSLAACQTEGCNTAPILYLPIIVNQLRVSMRRDIQTYLQARLYCEDPCCTNETYQLPFQFEGAFPVCDLCHKALLVPKYDDYALYNQLNYYQHVFDLEAAMNALDSKQKQFLRRGADFERLRAAYARLHDEVQRCLELSNYRRVSLDALFRDMALPATEPSD